jgi:uncharacterized protein (TIGR02594 family)
MRDSLETARAMAAEGKSSEEIRAVTGWFPGKYDGKMRWEIPDNGATLKPDFGKAKTVSDLIDHPALFEAYPSLAGVSVEFRGLTAGITKDGKTLVLPLMTRSFSADNSALLKGVLHETQHLVQAIEGFARGGTPEMAYDPEKRRIAQKQAMLEKSRDEAKVAYDANRSDTNLSAWKAAVDAVWEVMGEKPAKLPQESEMAYYYRIAGEIEARDVEARASLTPEQLKATAPYSSDNIAPETAIVLYQKDSVRPQGAKGSAQMTPEGKALVKGLENPDFTTGVHELWHAFEILGYPGWTDAEVADFKREVGDKTKGRTLMAPEGSERGDRAWERYIAEGRAPTPRLKAMFDKMAKWMLDVYGQIKGSDIDVKITSRMRELFDKLASRIGDVGTVADPLEDLVNSLQEESDSIENLASQVQAEADPLEDLVSSLQSEALNEEEKELESLPDTATVEELREAAPTLVDTAAIGALKYSTLREFTSWLNTVSKALVKHAAKIWKAARVLIIGAIAVPSIYFSTLSNKEVASVGAVSPNVENVANTSPPAKIETEVIVKPEMVETSIEAEPQTIKVSTDEKVVEITAKSFPPVAVINIDTPKAREKMAEPEEVSKPVVKKKLTAKQRAEKTINKMEREYGEDAPRFGISLPGESALWYLSQGENTSVSAAMTMLGEKEGTSKDIKKVLVSMGVNESPSTFPWCTTFTSWSLNQAGINAKSNSARSYLGLGQPTNSPAFGDVVVMWNENPNTGGKNGWGGHTGFYVGEVSGRILVLSGNSADSVDVSAFDKGRVLGYRHFAGKRDLAKKSTQEKPLKGGVDPVSTLLLALAGAALAKKRNGGTKQETLDEVNEGIDNSGLDDAGKKSVRDRLLGVIDKSFAEAPIVKAPAPAAIVTPSGIEMHTDDGSPLPPAIAPNEEAPADTSAEDELAGRFRHALENPVPPPATGGPTVMDKDDFPYELFSLRKEDAESEPDKYNLAKASWEQITRSLEANWETVMAQPAGYGEIFLDRLVREGDRNRVLTDPEVATLVHEGLRRKQAVDKAEAELLSVISQNGSKELVAEKQTALDNAMARYQTMHNVAAAARTAAGRALNAWKYAIQRDFTYINLYPRVLAAYNSTMIRDGQPPIKDLPEDQKEKIRKYAEEQRALQEEVNRLRAAAETANPEAYLKRIAEQDALIAAMIEERKNAGKKTIVADVTKKLLVDKIRQAAREARARLGISEKPDDGIRYQMAPNSANDPLWYDRVLVMAEPLIANPAMSAAQFADFVLRQFGAAYESVADLLRTDAEKLLRATLEDISGEEIPSSETVVERVSSKKVSPEELFEGFFPEEELTRQDVYDLARAHIAEGARDFEVMDRVFADLIQIYPDLTKDEVTQLFTNYGVQPKRDASEEAIALRAARSLELVQKQIDDLETNSRMMRTGRAKDQLDIKLRDLRKKRDDLAKAMGYVPTDPDTGLSSAQGAARKRMLNEIEELQKAIDSGERRVRVRRGVEYTGDLPELREKLLALRESYEKIFKSDRTPEERMRMMVADLDRRIAKEKDLINKGILENEKEALPVLDSPEITARREALRNLRLEKFAAYDLLHPNERSLNQAMKEAQTAVERRQKLLDEGLKETPQKRQRGEGVNATAALQALWEAADALDVKIHVIRRNRKLTPAQQQAQLDRAYAQAVASREVLRERIQKGNILAAPTTPKVAEQRTRLIREENAAMRKQLVQMQKDAGVGVFSQEAREAKRVASLEARVKEVNRRRKEEDFSKKTVAKPVTSERIAQLELQLEYGRFKFEEARARDAFKGLKMSTQAFEVTMAAWHARQMFNLSGDFGIFGRQLGKVRTLILWEDAKALWKRARAGEPLNVREGTILGKTLGAGMKVFFNKKMEDVNTAADTIYAELATSPRYAFLKANGLDLTRPHESSHELNSDGRVRVNPMQLFDNRLIGALMIVRGLIGTVAGVKVALYTSAPVWGAITKGIGNTLFGAGLAVAGVAFARRVEAAQVTMLNIARVGVTEAMLQITEGLDPSAKENASEDIVEAVMTLTGKIAGKKGLSKWIKDNSYMIGLFARFPQYKYTNLKSAAGTPLLGALWDVVPSLKRDKGSRLGFTTQQKPGSKQTLAAVSIMMAHMYGGYAARMVTWAILFGVWDEEDEETTYGVVLNPNNPNFGKLKIGKTFVDLAPGWGTWFVDFARFASDTKLDPVMLREGYEIEKTKASYDIRDTGEKFLIKQLATNVTTLLDINAGEFKEGGDLRKMDAWNATDVVLGEIMMNLTIRDINKIYEEHDPVTATALASLIMTGQNLNIRETNAEVAAREAQERKRYTINPNKK